MKFSYVMLPDYPLSESLESIKLADELGFYAVYAADETWHKDLWLLFAAAADKTSATSGWARACRPSCCASRSLIAQAAATLDELTGGRAEVVLSSGNFGLLAQYGMDWSTQKPLSRVKEGVHVIRTLLDDGAITFDGEFFTYKGLFTFARPVQERVPVKMGAMRGPKSFQVAAEFSDGCHHALSYTRERVRVHVREHDDRRRAGRQERRRPRHRRLGACSPPARTRPSRQGRRPVDGRAVRVVDAGRAAGAQRGVARGDEADPRRARRRRPGRRDRRHHPRSATSCRSPAPPRSASRRSRRSRRPASTT